MSFEHLDKTRLINLEYSLFKEVLRTNRAGSYSSSSIVGCNTRKYHGLLVTPLEKFEHQRHVLLSSLDVSVIQHDKVFNLGIHKYAGSHYEPKGHKYIRDFDLDPIPQLIYRVGGVVLKQEIVLVEKESQVLLRYTLEEAHSPTILRLKPFMAFRNVHALTHQNLNANIKYNDQPNGVRLKLYEDFPYLYMQTNKESDFVGVPDWYCGIEYIKEQKRGYDFVEDLYTPGYFEVSIEKGESIVFAAGTLPANPNGLKARFTREAKKRIPRNSLQNNLLNAAQQFIIQDGNVLLLMAGYHWYGPRLRDTLVALPGLTVYQNQKEVFVKILHSAVKQIDKEYLKDKHVKLGFAHSLDAPLWLFWTLSKCAEYCSYKNVWEEYGPVLKKILHFYKNNQSDQMCLTDEGLIYAQEMDVPLTWMDAMVEDVPVTPRYGMPVEVNALWYNAICYAVYLAREAKDDGFVKEWLPMIDKVGSAFMDTFWMEKKGYLADVVDKNQSDSAIRPNQIITVAMDFSPLGIEQKNAVVEVVKKELLTPLGLRSLSPQDAKYRGVVEGSIAQQGLALHQGTAYPWLMAFFADAYLKLHKQGGVTFIKRLLDGFEKEMSENCLGTISECYNGNPPHSGKGAVSMAWNVAGVLRVIKLIESYE